MQLPIRTVKALFANLLLVATVVWNATPLPACAQCGGTTVSQPVTVDDETSNLPNSRQLVNGTNSTVDTSTAGQIKINVTGGGSGVSSVNPGTETTIGGTSSAPTVNVQFAINATLTANTTLAIGTIYPCNTSAGTFTVTLPSAATTGNKGAHIVVFLKTAGNALSVATTSSQLINGQSAPISVSNANTFLLFVADGTNWQCVPMQPATGQTTNQWVTYIDALGAQHTAQIAFSNLSGSATAAQMLALPSGQIYVGNGSSQPVATTPSAGTGLSVSAGSGSLQYSLSTPVTVANGGSGTGTAPTSGQLLIGTSGGGYSVANLTAGSNVTITNSSGGISIASSGSGGGGFTYTSESSSFSAAVQNCYEVTATATCTLPTAVGNSGKEIMVWFNATSGTLTFNTTSSQTMSGIASGSLSTAVQYDLYRFVSNGSNWIIE